MNQKIQSYMLTNDYEDQLDWAENKDRRYIDFWQLKKKIKNKWVTILTFSIMVIAGIAMFMKR